MTTAFDCAIVFRMQGCTVRPMNGRVLVERLDETDGKERVLASGLVLPPKDMTLKRGRSKEIPDTFLARVMAVSVEAAEHVSVGDEVIVHTYDQRPDTTLAGEETAYGLLVRLEDVLAVVEDEPVVDGVTLRRALKDYTREVERGILAALVPKPPESVNDLGFHLRSAK